MWLLSVSYTACIFFKFHILQQWQEKALTASPALLEVRTLKAGNY